MSCGRIIPEQAALLGVAWLSEVVVPAPVAEQLITLSR